MRSALRQAEQTLCAGAVLTAGFVRLVVPACVLICGSWLLDSHLSGRCPSFDTTARCNTAVVPSTVPAGPSAVAATR